MFFTIVLIKEQKKRKENSFEARMHLLISFPIRFSLGGSFLNAELASAALKIPQGYCRLESYNLATLRV